LIVALGGTLTKKKTQFGLVTSKRSPGAVLRVIGLDSDLLRVESDGFSGTVSVGKTDFWKRAERTRSAAIDRQNREKQLAKDT
jgi:hypothetical protein